LGGIGFGSASASVGVFVGYLNADQSIDALSARNKSDGVVAGVSAYAASDGFEVSATLAYDGSTADTTRSLPGAGTSSAHYGLRSVTADTALGYVMPLGGGWTAKPQIGFTGIWTKRDNASESGSTPYNLTVASRRNQTSFVDGLIEFSGNLGAFQPWLRVGVRHQLSDDNRDAKAAFTGATSSFTVAGVSRSATLGTAGAGANVVLGKGVSLAASYDGEFGSDSSGYRVHAGLRIAF
jgi:fibronectin-binding autotransporter adhesin